MSLRERLRRIYEFVAAACPPATLPEGVPFALASGDLRGPGPADLLDQLLQAFALRDLLDCGVAIAEPPGDDGDAEPTIALHPGLGPQGGGLLALRDARQCEPFGLVVDGELLPSSKLACIAVLDDYRCQAALDDSRTVFLTDGLGDLAAMWSLGLVAAPIFGLAELGGAQLAAFRTLYARRATGPGAANLYGTTKAPTVILVGWSPFSWNLNESAAMRAVVEHLRALHDHLGVDLSGVRYWRLDPDGLTKLGFILRYGSSQGEIRNAVMSAGRSAPPLIEADASASELVIALADWRRAVANPVQVKDANSATAELHELLRARFGDPLIAQAGSTSDPVRANLLMALSQLMETIHIEGLRPDLRLRVGVTDGSGGNGTASTLLQTIDRALAIVKTLTSVRIKKRDRK